MRRAESILPAFLSGAVFFLVSLGFQTHGISGGDSGDLVTAAATGGVPHPPGYPLYTLLGFFLNKLPLFSPAWRVGLLSSIFQSLSIVLVFFITTLLTKKRVCGLFSAATIAGTYLFFYYSITPEVFALLNFFLASILYILFLWYETRSSVYFYLAAFVFFLSLSHHHVILFGLPAFALGILHFKKNIFEKKTFSIILVLAVLGLLPYVYAPIAGRSNSIIYWNNPKTLEGFLKLVSRADYGTFQSGGVYGELPIQRLLSVKAFGQFVLSDFGWGGILFACIGAWWLYKKKRWHAKILGVALFFFGPFFFFYASFPIVNNFTLGIYERFLLPSYVILSIFIGVAILPLLTFATRSISLFIANKFLRKFAIAIVVCLIFLYPLRLSYQTLRISQGLAHDMTANRLGEDILSQTKPGAVVILSGDTALFISQYVRYALGFRQDTKVIHANGLLNNEYPKVVQSVFPELATSDKRGADFFQDFIQGNIDRFPIYVNQIHPIPEGMFLVPRGLLYELVWENDLPSIDHLATESAMLFSSYQNPLDGVLKRYKHLMLADIQEIYAEAGQRMGTIFLNAGKLDQSEKYFLYAINLSEDNMLADNYLNLGIVYFLQEKCNQALDSFNKSREYRDDKNNAKLIAYEIATYRECLNDEQKAEEISKQYDVLDQSGHMLKRWQ
jgi:hypothetical protein